MKKTKLILSILLCFQILMIPSFASEEKDYISNIGLRNNESNNVILTFSMKNEAEVKNLTLKTWNVDYKEETQKEENLEILNKDYEISMNLEDFKGYSGIFESQIEVELINGEIKTYETETFQLTMSEDNQLNSSSDNESLQTEEQELLVAQSSFGIDNISVENNGQHYTITATISGNNISYVSFPTWTLARGQDDIIWGQGEVKGNVVKYTVKMKDHGYEDGDYQTHIYAYDTSGNVTAVEVPVQRLVKMMPNVENVQISNNGTSYTITAELKGMDIQTVLFPTWTLSMGQDDITWGQGVVTGDRVSYTVDMSDHKYEDGNYQTHIYAYDALGQLSAIEVPIQRLEKITPSIENVQVKNTGISYTITADIKGMGIQTVLFPTWSSKNGQDDLMWGQGEIKGNKVTFTVKIGDHGYEDGEYQTHIYAYDVLGNVGITAITNQHLERILPTIGDLQIKNNTDSYTITAKVKGMDIKSVKFPTWTIKNGQDDMIWGDGAISGDTVSYTVYPKHHNFEEGNYQTHIYVYDATGQVTAVEVPLQTIQLKSPEIKNVKVTNSAGKYKIECDILGSEITTVMFPTWSIRNGQDDIFWGTGNINGNRVSYEVDFKYHNYETGTYQTHIYAYDANGKVTAMAINPQDIINAAPVVTNITVSDVTSQGYLVTCQVSDDYGVSHVLFPTWSNINGQDDITWGTGTVNGNSVSYRVYIKDHKFDFGSYTTHIYAYDKAGAMTAVGVPIVSINETSTPGWKITNGHKYLYDANGKIVGNGLLVIDISEHNGDINWTAVKNAGVDGVILRSSYGFDYSNDVFNNSQMDKKFARNVAELNRLGIPYGVYHFTYARNIGDGTLEAKYLLDCLKAVGAKPTLPIYYDLESSKYVGEKSNEFYTQITKEFANVIRSNGYNVGVYANYNWWTNKLTDSSFDSYVKWVAHYGTDQNNAAGTANPYWHPNSAFRMWQYTSKGRVNGITSNVDMNILFNGH